MKVAKFGGSSLSNASQIKKVATIIANNPDMKAVVVSAPGKRYPDDTKVTDLLIDIHHRLMKKQSPDEAINLVLKRYEEIIHELGLSNNLIPRFRGRLEQYIQTLSSPSRLLDALKSCGEDFNAQVIAHYLRHLGLEARYISPLEAGIRVTDEPANARLLDFSYKEIAKLKQKNGILIIPGFFGYSLNDDIVTFSRGGSDISGAIVANAFDAEIYENYTDESFIYAMHPGKIDQPVAIKQITYQEMRELSYAGFAIFHDEALEPVYRKDIPVMIRNTNQPEIEGTTIMAKRQLDAKHPVIGISSDSGFMSISIDKYLLNRERTFIRQTLQIFEEFGLSVEHIPSGIDNISLILRKNQIQSIQHLNQLLEALHQQLKPDAIHVEDELVLLAIVGEGLQRAVGAAAAATRTFAEHKINIRMISQGASEISMLFIIPEADEQQALKGLYQTYFKTQND